MTITITPDDVTPIAVSLDKFRENSKDSIVYLSKLHTVELPKLVTVTSQLPTPRKGNLGTMKTTINSRWTVNIASSGEPVNPVPIIVKLQTSFPVGSQVTDMREACRIIQNFLGQTEVDFKTLFQTGLLPSD